MLARVRSPVPPPARATAAPAAAAGPAARDPRSVAKERAENFPVALRVLPRAVRHDLRAVYDVARLADDTGDEGAGDRTGRLEALSAELADLWAGRPVRTPELVRLVPAGGWSRGCGPGGSRRSPSSGWSRPTCRTSGCTATPTSTSCSPTARCPRLPS